MLPVEHRIRTPREFGTVMKTGTRAGTRSVVVVLVLSQQRPEHHIAPWRCGFIVSKAVGNAVIRHRTTRRLRHIVRDLLPEFSATLPAGTRMDVVVRALAASAELDHEQLSADVRSGVKRALRKAGAAAEPTPPQSETENRHV